MMQQSFSPFSLSSLLTYLFVSSAQTRAGFKTFMLISLCVPSFLSYLTLLTKYFVLLCATTLCTCTAFWCSMFAVSYFCLLFAVYFYNGFLINMTLNIIEEKVSKKEALALLFEGANSLPHYTSINPLFRQR